MLMSFKKNDFHSSGISCQALPWTCLSFTQSRQIVFLLFALVRSKYHFFVYWNVPMLCCISFFNVCLISFKIEISLYTEKCPYAKCVYILCFFFCTFFTILAYDSICLIINMVFLFLSSLTVFLHSPHARVHAVSVCRKSAAAMLHGVTSHNNVTWHVMCDARGHPAECTSGNCQREKKSVVRIG